VYCQLINYYLKCIFDIYTSGLRSLGRIYVVRPNHFFCLAFYTQRNRSRLSTLLTTLPTSGLLLLNLICLSLLIHGDEHRLNYGIVLKKCKSFSLHRQFGYTPGKLTFKKKSEFKQSTIMITDHLRLV
jgi:hypothetical protein